MKYRVRVSSIPFSLHLIAPPLNNHTLVYILYLRAHSNLTRYSHAPLDASAVNSRTRSTRALARRYI